MIKELQIRKNELKLILDEAREKRNQLNSEASGYASQRNELNKKTKQLIEIAQEYKSKRDAINVEVSKNKDLRDETNARANELFAQADSLRKGSNLDGPSLKQMKKQLENLEFTQQTTVQSPQKEKELVNKIKELGTEYETKKKKLEENTDLKNLLEEAQSIRDEASVYHDKLAECAKLAQEYHEKMIATFKEADQSRSESDIAHKNFVRAQEAADEQHKIFIQKQQEIREIDRELGRPKRSKDAYELYDKAEAEKGAQDIIDKFKDGGTLTVEDLMALQRSKY